MARTAAIGALFSAASSVGAVAIFDGEQGYLSAHAANSQSGDSAESLYDQRIRKGDTLIRLLKSAGVTPKNAAATAGAVKKVFDPRQLRVGQRMMIRFDSGPGDAMRLSVFTIELGKNRFVEVVRQADGRYRARRASQPWSPERTSTENHGTGGMVTLEARSGSTIGKILRALNIRERDIDRAVKALRTRFDPRQLRVGQKISILPGAPRSDGKLTLLGVAVHLKNGAFVEVRGDGNGGFSARRLSALTLADGAGGDVALGNSGPQPVAGERQKLRVPKGATLMNMLIKRGISRVEADKAVRAVQENFDPRRLRAGQFIYLVVTENSAGKPELQGLSIAITDKRHVTVRRENSGRFTSGLARTPIDSLADITPAAKTPATTPASSAPAAKVAKLDETEAPAPAKPQQAAAESQATPAATPVDANSDINAATILVDRGDTLMAILRSEGIDRHEADRAIRALRKLFNPRRLREGQQIILATRADKSGAILLEGFSIKIGKDRHIEVMRSDAKNFAAAKVSEPNFAARTALANRDAENVTREGVRLTPRRGQGQAMTGAMIAAAAPAEQMLEADAAKVWPREIRATGARSAFSISALQKKRAAADDLTRKAVMIGKGDTLFVALTKAGSAANDAEAAIAAFREVHNPRSLQIGQTLTLAFEPMVNADKAQAFRLAEIALDVAPDRDVLVARQADG
ncbi:MAG: hypothetical protein CFH38_01201, partial [Alphaproteobacteria bacterium MarineAlpha10_Bin1]